LIRFINCIKRRDDISQQEFRNYWNSEEFEELRYKVVAISGAKKSSKSLTLQVEANVLLMQDRGTAEPYDGTFEYFWDNAASLMDVYDTGDAIAAMREMNGYLEQFVDMSKSSAFFTEG